MTQSIMSDSAPLILYGDDFPDEAIHVLNTMPDIEIIALVSETPEAITAVCVGVLFY